jgi:hypothetical protein
MLTLRHCNPRQRIVVPELFIGGHRDGNVEEVDIHHDRDVQLQYPESIGWQT